MGPMSKKKPSADDPDKRPEGPPPGRKRVKYVALPIALWEELDRIAKDNERSVSWVARQAVKQYLERRKSESKEDT